jgi:nitroreductase
MPEPLSDSTLDQLFRDARSFNYWQDREVSDSQIQAIYDLTKMGPTSGNQQSARFVWCKSADARERLAALASEGNRHKILSAPVTVIVAMDLEFHEQLPWLLPHTDARSWFTGSAELRRANALRNSSLQGAYLMLAARALGLDCGPMSGFDNDAVDAEFFPNEPQWKSNFICALGYGDAAKLRQRSPRPEFDTFNRLV